MKVITVTEMARNFSSIMDQLEFGGEEIALVRKHQEIAHILPGATHQTALEAMADLHRTLADDAADGWIEDSQRGLSKPATNRLRNPWRS